MADALTDGLDGTRVLLVALAVAAGVAVVGHLAAILASGRLK